MQGSVIHSTINGQILLKSYLTGSPEMRLGLNEDLVVRSLGIRTLSFTLFNFIFFLTSS